jgi:outer membrane receptor for ferrienterochelin and colicins
VRVKRRAFVAVSIPLAYCGAGRDPNAYGTSDSQMLVLDTQVNHYLGGHVISWGAQHTSEALADAQPAYERFIDETYRNTGVFLQDDWSFARGFELIAGGRCSSTCGDAGSPRVPPVPGRRGGPPPSRGRPGFW